MEDQMNLLTKNSTFMTVHVGGNDLELASQDLHDSKKVSRGHLLCFFPFNFKIAFADYRIHLVLDLTACCTLPSKTYEKLHDQLLTIK